MAVPTFDQLLRPILQFAAKEPITRKSALQQVIAEFKLSEAEQQETISSGNTKISNRTGWAMSHLTKGGLIALVAKHTYQATAKGKEYLQSHVGPITVADLKEIEGWKEAWAAASTKKKNKATGSQTGGGDDATISLTTPEEMIDEAVGTLADNLRSELLDHLSQVNPYRFERVVIDLLIAMGYGGSRAEAAEVTKKSGDEGVDGLIKEDRLGLDVIYVQAKRWKNPVGRNEIQNFVGALAGKQANKGVFITTSTFIPSARDFAKAVPQKVILIDGERLTSLMIEHGIGVSITRMIEVKRIDSDYFEED